MTCQTKPFTIVSSARTLLFQHQRSNTYQSCIDGERVEELLHSAYRHRQEKEGRTFVRVAKERRTEKKRGKDHGNHCSGVAAKVDYHSFLGSVADDDRQRDQQHSPGYGP